MVHLAVLGLERGKEQIIMALTNPALIATRTISTEMKKMETPKVKSSNTLMGPPKKQMTKGKESDILQPSRRVAFYIETIRKQREDINNA